MTGRRDYVYPRCADPLARDVVVYQRVSEGNFKQLIDIFRRDLESGSIDIGDEFDEYQVAWCRLVFALTVVSGAAGEGDFTAVAQLRLGDLFTCTEGYMRLPRRGGWTPLAIPDEVHLCALSLAAHLGRITGGARRRAFRVSTDWYVLPNLGNRLAPPDREALKGARSLFRRWLNLLSRAAGVSINHRQLRQLARCRLPNIYPPCVAGSMLAHHHFHPAPSSQQDVLDAFRQPLDGERIEQLTAGYQSYEQSEVNDSTGSAPRRRVLSKELEELPDLVAPYCQADRDERADRRAEVKEALAAYRRAQFEFLGVAGAVDPVAALAGLQLTARAVDHLNGLVIAGWLRWLLGRRLAPNSVRSYLYDILALVRDAPGKLIYALDEQAFFTLLRRRRLSPASRERAVAAFNGLREVARREFVRSLPHVNSLWVSGRPTTRLQPLLTPADIERLIAALRAMEADECFTVAVLLGYYFGLRVSEMAALRLGQLVTEPSPTIYVWKSKRDSSRRVVVEQLPHWESEVLGGYRSRRAREVSDDLQARLLADAQGQPVSADTIIRKLGQAMALAGIDIMVGGKASVTHALRHAAANRWLACGLPLTDVTHLLGHRSVDTTIQNYLHTFHFMQREHHTTHQMHNEPLSFTTKGVTLLLGVTSRQVRNLARQHDIPAGGEWPEEAVLLELSDIRVKDDTESRLTSNNLDRLPAELSWVMGGPQQVHTASRV
ncbi:MAG: tyrosine-type recombinase/integrase [Anaerolineae bacterium]|nr:tyrosine-type recombinase/integrase [Anaerolineae bacterium]